MEGGRQEKQREELHGQAALFPANNTMKFIATILVLALLALSVSSIDAHTTHHQCPDWHSYCPSTQSCLPFAQEECLGHPQDLGENGWRHEGEGDSAI